MALIVQTRSCSRPLRASAVILAIALAPLATSCSLDPVHADAVNALGGEADGVPTGPLHRPGQPCATCHSAAGPASTPFVVAGTVFADATGNMGVDAVQVTMTDDLATSYTATTNAAGNFFVTTDQWNPAFPIIVQISKDAATIKMQSQISRASSCADCHKDPHYYDALGHIHLATIAERAAPTPPVVSLSSQTPTRAP